MKPQGQRLMNSLLVSRSICLGAALATSGLASAQSFNIDIEHYLGDPPSGYGVPSSDFGAAANQPGFWNAYSGNGQIEPTALRDLNGQLTTVSVRRLGPFGNVGGGSNFPIVTGNYALLLNDYIHIADVTFTFAGLTDGRYKIYTYGIEPNYFINAIRVTVSGSLTPNPQVSGNGFMPQNAFVEGVTHCVHEIIVTHGTFDLHAIDYFNTNIPVGYINGFQIVAVPEPSTCLIVAAPLAVCLRRRRQRIVLVKK
jgi:hypothetical protein